MCFVRISQQKATLPYTTLTDCLYNRGVECSLRGTDWVLI